MHPEGLRRKKRWEMFLHSCWIGNGLGVWGRSVGRLASETNRLPDDGGSNTARVGVGWPLLLLGNAVMEAFVSDSINPFPPVHSWITGGPQSVIFGVFYPRSWGFGSWNGGWEVGFLMMYGFATAWAAVSVRKVLCLSSEEQ